MTTHSGRAGLPAVDDAVDRLIDQLIDQFREARAEHSIATAKMKAEFNVAMSAIPCFANSTRTLPEVREGALRNDVIPVHSMISSARASNVGGIVSPSAFAVLTLIASGNWVGNSIGKFPGGVPCRILSTK
jgi:hypothetical protein